MDELIYRGKAKEIYQTDDETVLRAHYLDQVTALNGLKQESLPGKGALTNRITCEIFTYLTQQGFANHFIRKVSETDQLIQRVTMLPVEFVVRNVAAGSFAARFQVPKGTILPEPVLEYYLKDDALADPLMVESHLYALNIATPEQIQTIQTAIFRLNTLLQDYFSPLSLELIDFKVEFGQTATGELLLADEISPDTCRLWDKATGASFDKDIYRNAQGDLLPVYEAVSQRITAYYGGNK